MESARRANPRHAVFKAIGEAEVQQLHHHAQPEHPGENGVNESHADCSKLVGQSQRPAFAAQIGIATLHAHEQAMALVLKAGFGVKPRVFCPGP